jgi:hypothetical protein
MVNFRSISDSLRSSKRMEQQLADIQQQQAAQQQQIQWAMQQQLLDAQKKHEEEMKRRDDARRAEEGRLRHQLEAEQRLRIEEAKRNDAELKRQAEMKFQRDRQEREQRELVQRKHDIKLQRLRTTTPDALRSLRELIRRKYELDMLIWADRKVRRPDRPFVEANMEQADAVLAEITMIVGTWGEDHGDSMWKDHEKPLAQEVHARLHEDGKRWWRDGPPWEED